jgi:uncharacterized protein (DUF697 family)/tellurite resistance protein
MTAQEARSILSIALMAAFADSLKDERERAAVKRVAEALGPDAGFDLPGLYRDVLLAKPDLAQAAAALQSSEARQLAYEMAVGVCDADGAQGPAERELLGRLATVLGLDHATAAATSSAADEVADAAFSTTATARPADVADTQAASGATAATDTRGQVGAPAAASAAPEAGTAAAAAPVDGTVTGRPTLTDAELDKLVLNASITNAALELLPESLASMAIIPLQVRLVYRIGRSYGYPMDTSHAKDFIATLGVGLTGQYLEQFGRKLLGGLLGSLGGGLGRAAGRQAASSGFSFATTYAIGRLAQRYYAGGRTLDAATLKSTFAGLLEEARGLAPAYRTQIEQKASTIDVSSLASLVRRS